MRLRRETTTTSSPGWCLIGRRSFSSLDLPLSFHEPPSSPFPSTNSSFSLSLAPLSLSLFSSLLRLIPPRPSPTTLAFLHFSSFLLSVSRLDQTDRSYLFQTTYTVSPRGADTTNIEVYVDLALARRANSKSSASGTNLSSALASTVYTKPSTMYIYIYRYIYNKERGLWLGISPDHDPRARSERENTETPIPRNFAGNNSVAVTFLKVDHVIGGKILYTV